MPPLDERRHGGDRADDYRSPFARDRDRILYSSAFRRLSGVTQVVSADETLLFHNRMTHSLKVAQVSRRIAERLNDEQPDAAAAGYGIDPDAVEAAALAHDFGHPPYGHIAEGVLQELCDDAGIMGYEGNAQTFRIVTKLSQRTTTAGLNLTRRTLQGVLKYPWLREGDHENDRKWGAYHTELLDYQFAYGEEGPAKSLEAQVMDWADDITYAVHDLEDFYRAGLTPIDRSHVDQREVLLFVNKANRSLARYDEFDPEAAAVAFEEILNLIPLERPYEGTVDDRVRMHETASNLITRFVAETTLKGSGKELHIDSSIWHEVNMLKQLTWHYVIDSPSLATLQEGQKSLIRSLFEKLMKWVNDEGQLSERLPTRLREMFKAIERDAEAQDALDEDDSKIRARCVADYIASLTEAQAAELHERLLGLSGSSVLHAWMRV